MVPSVKGTAERAAAPVVGMVEGVVSVGTTGIVGVPVVSSGAPGVSGGTTGPEPPGVDVGSSAGGVVGSVVGSPVGSGVEMSVEGEGSSTVVVSLSVVTDSGVDMVEGSSSVEEGSVVD